MDASSDIFTIDAAALSKAVQLLSPLRGTVDLPAAMSLRRLGAQAALHVQSIDMECLVPILRSTPPHQTIQLPAPAVTKLLAGAWSGEMDIRKLDNTSVQISIHEEISSIFSFQAPVCAPFWKGRENLQSATVEGKLLRASLKFCEHAISKEETRYYLNGINIRPLASDPTSLVFNATDGHRLTQRIITGVTHSLADSIILPSAAVKLLLRLLTGGGAVGDLEIGIHGHRIFFESDAFTLTAKLLDGVFPDVARVIPQNAPEAATFAAAPLRQFCKRIAGLKSAPTVKLVTDKKTGTLTASWASPEIGTVMTKMEAAVSRNLEIGFQHKYLTHAMETLAAEQVTLFASDGESPAIIATAAELTDPTTTIVIMPIRV